VRVSAHAPKVRLLSPNGGKPLGERVKVRWKSSDADRNRRWYTVLYTPDGEHFVPVATGIRRTSVRVNLTTLPGGGSARFEVIASDGVRTGSDRSDRAFAVPVKPPHVSIATPVAGAEFLAGPPITFVSSTTDLQDGTLPASKLEWRSSLQGILGRGPAVTTALQPGRHVITLIATNQEGASAESSVEITVNAVPPFVLATIVP
jgi:hypothetical protein